MKSLKNSNSNVHIQLKSIKMDSEFNLANARKLSVTIKGLKYPTKKFNATLDLVTVHEKRKYQITFYNSVNSAETKLVNIPDYLHYLNVVLFVNGQCYIIYPIINITVIEEVPLLIHVSEMTLKNAFDERSVYRIKNKRFKNWVDKSVKREMIKNYIIDINKMYKDKREIKDIISEMDRYKKLFRSMFNKHDTILNKLCGFHTKKDI